jgi:hypothetical protein
MFENGDELERMWRENIVASFIVMAQTFYRGTEWYYKKPQVRWPHSLDSAATF